MNILFFVHSLCKLYVIQRQKNYTLIKLIMKLRIILSAAFYFFFFTHNSFAQKTADEYYQEAKNYEHKSKFTKAFKQYQVAAGMGLVTAQISLAKRKPD